MIRYLTVPPGYPVGSVIFTKYCFRREERREQERPLCINQRWPLLFCKAEGRKKELKVFCTLTLLRRRRYDREGSSRKCWSNDVDF